MGGYRGGRGGGGRGGGGRRSFCCLECGLLPRVMQKRSPHAGQEHGRKVFGHSTLLDRLDDG